MTMKEDLKTYKARWLEVEAIITLARRSYSLELRWRQINTAFGMAKGLGILCDDPSEMGVIERWAKIKDEAANQPPKV